MTARHLRIVIAMVALAVVVERRDVIGEQVSGFASVAGVVITTDDPPRRVRRAIVSLRSNELELGYHAITDDQGRFAISDVPPGRYDLSAKRAAFVTIAHGATQPESPGTKVVLAANQHVTDATLRLAPGAVITGTVRDDTGAAAPDLEVFIERRKATGENFQRVARTDPRGVYRFFGLAAGSYTVYVRPLRTNAQVNYASNDAEVDALLQQLQQGRYGAPQPQQSAPPQPRPTVEDFTTVFFMNATSIQNAIPVAVAAGDERGGVDMMTRRMLK